jgi:predicted nucleic acid-binding protein
MASSTLERIPDGARIFVDSVIFIYHFTGLSNHCRTLIQRCEYGAVRGITSTLVLAEVTHRLMLIEATAKRLITPGNQAHKLRDKPNVVRELHAYQEQVEQIPLLGIEVQSIEPSLLFRAANLRGKYGLLTNDSLVLQAAVDAASDGLATADGDFECVTELLVYRPADLRSEVRCGGTAFVARAV